MNIQHSKPYRNARRVAYPNVYDQLDVIWKYLALCEDDLPKETADMLQKILDVKAVHPKEGLSDEQQNNALNTGKITHTTRDAPKNLIETSIER